MNRTRAEVEHAIEQAAIHAWERHGAEGMYAKLGIRSRHELRDHIVETVWSEQTACFTASADREVFYDRSTNTRVILNYRASGTCLMTRSGAREFERQYDDEMTRHAAMGNPPDTMPPIVIGGIRTLHPGLPQR